MTIHDVLAFQQLMFSIAAVALAACIYSIVMALVVKPAFEALERRRDLKRRRRTYRAVGR